MIKRVLIISLVVFIIALVIFWFITGGWAGAARTARSLANPLELIFGASASGSFLKLPWQPPELTRGPDISDYAGEADARILASGDEDQFANTPPASTGAFGNPSPYAGKVVIRESAATESDAAREYIQLTASQNNTQPISITNWTLQSAVSGARGTLPPAAPFFVLGAVNTVQPMYLEPGDSVFITTGASPVGTSFRENICSGYLSELQKFTPELSNECPTPPEMLPMNADNLRTYGSSCFDYLNALTQCHFPTTLPGELSSACRSFISNTMSYNGCINFSRDRIPFVLPTFRAYLGLRSELWSNSHDVIRLIDEQGQTVDVLTY